MNKNPVFITSLCVSALALCIAAYSGYRILYQPAVLPSVAAESRVVAEDGTPETKEPVAASTVFNIVDSKLNPAGNLMPLRNQEDVIAVSLPEDATDVEYDQEQGYLAWNCGSGHITLTAIPASEISSNYARSFESEDERVIVAMKKVTENTGINMVTSTTEENLEAMKEAADAVCESASACTDMSFAVCGLSVNPEWTASMAKNVLCLTHAEDRVTMSVYGSSLGDAGFDNTAKVGEAKFLYGSYKDSETGYVPYMYTCDAGTLKVMATSTDVLNAVFGQVAETDVAENVETDAENAA